MKTMEQMRRGLKTVDEVELPMDSNFYDRLHNKIMTQIEKTEIAPPSPLMKPTRFLRESWRSVVDPVGSSMK